MAEKGLTASTPKPGKTKIPIAKQTKKRLIFPWNPR